jgi:hypothetical protein
MLRELGDGKPHAALLVQVPPKALAGLVFEELQRHLVCVAMHPVPIADKLFISAKSLK